MRTRAAILLGLLLFAVWTVGAMTPAVMQADTAITLAVQRSASSALDKGFSLMTLAGNAEVTAAAALVMGIGLVRTGRAPAAVALWAVFAGGSAVEVALKDWVPHPGPPLSLRRIQFRLLPQPIKPPYAYPSGHTFRTLLLAGAAGMLWRPFLKRIRLASAILGVMPLLMGFALIYLGGHWSSEVVGGYLLAGTGLAVLRVVTAPA